MTETILRVNTTVDELDSGANEGTGLSLREAVAIANNTSEDEIIELQSEQVYEIGAELDIASTGGTLTIRGVGATINANGNSRVLHVNSDDNSVANLILENTIVTGGLTAPSGFGDSNGGGILVDPRATARLTNCTVTGNATADTDDKGGGIANQGGLTLNNCVVSNNSADVDGGGIYTSYGNTTIINSTIANNSVNDTTASTPTGTGGGVSHRGAGTTEINNSTVSDNTANFAGGGVYIDDKLGTSSISRTGSLRIVNSTISGNIAPYGGGIHSRRVESSVVESTVIENNSANFGGGVFVAFDIDSDDMVIENSTIRNNSATGNGGEGGGIYAEGSLRVSNSTISGNSATGDGGGAKSDIGTINFYDSAIDRNSAGGSGGGIKNINLIRGSTISNNTAVGDGGGIASGIGIIVDSTISGNTTDGSGGGIRTTESLFQDLTIAIANTTISGNTARLNGGGIEMMGSLDKFSDLIATNVTITGNIADSDNNGEGNGGGIHNPSGEFIPGELELSNSILEGNFDTPENSGEGLIEPNISGVALGNAHNLVGNLQGLRSETDSLGQGSDLIGVSPQLSQLQDNGGGILTHALLADSPAINAGNNGYILQETFSDLDNDGESTTVDFNGDGDFSDALEFDQRQADFARIFDGTVDIGAYEVQSQPEEEPSPEPSPDEDLLDTDIIRFQNNDVPGTYLYVAESEAQNIRENFDNFTEEGLAFQVSVEPNDDLMPMYRFQSEDNPGTYLFVGESERENIQENFAESFIEEGLAFYTRSANSELGTDFSRFQNTAQPGTYLFATGQERENIRENFPNFEEEGIAFNVDV